MTRARRPARDPDELPEDATGWTLARYVLEDFLRTVVMVRAAALLSIVTGCAPFVLGSPLPLTLACLAVGLAGVSVLLLVALQRPARVRQWAVLLIVTFTCVAMLVALRLTT